MPGNVIVESSVYTYFAKPSSKVVEPGVFKSGGG